MSSCNPLKIPVTGNGKFLKANDEVELAETTSYQSLIRSFLFVAIQTHLDLINGVNFLSRFIDKPTEDHVQGAKKCIIFMVDRNSKGVSKAKRFCSIERIMQAGVATKLIETQALTFNSSMASAVARTHGR